MLVAESESSSAAEQASKISGISSVIHVDDPIYKNFLAEDLGNLVASIAEDLIIYSLLLRHLVRIFTQSSR